MRGCIVIEIDSLRGCIIIEIDSLLSQHLFSIVVTSENSQHGPCGPVNDRQLRSSQEVSHFIVVPTYINRFTSKDKSKPFIILRLVSLTS